MSPYDDNTVRRDVRDLLTACGTLKANFVVLAGQDIGRKYEVNKAQVLIGRNETCDIFIDDEDVSRHHARIMVEPDKILIQDLGSTNGTLVNGARVARHILTNGDRVQIGNLTILKFNFLDEMEDTFNEQLYTAANKDFLTQAYNKKYFLDRLKMEVSHSRRHGVPLSLIIFDLDFFKQINDRYGHLVGDQVLKQLSFQVSQMKRHEDLLARYGGEEFVILLRDIPEENAVQIAEKLRTRIAESSIFVDNLEVRVTLSLGVATFFRNNYKNDESFLKAADHHLYLAKNKGRNQVHYSEQLQRSSES